jgi:hypothetical protein
MSVCPPQPRKPVSGSHYLLIEYRASDKLIGYETCPECHGTGVVKKGPCADCNSSGRIPIYDEDDDK